MGKAVIKGPRTTICETDIHILKGEYAEQTGRGFRREKNGIEIR
jgi:D-arabinose 1-dehydrogenase-like Zn-dependent alcohol dehydrogenase